ncbi:MAG: cell envelope integrity protein CreD [Bacteroidetes bacterium]|nr:cell envelope integrity protein CreD [Bacteroidota bacterium]
MESSLRNSVLLRMIFVVVLVLLLLIPQVMIESMITERQQRRDTVTDEISSKWGKSQIITGPFIVLPYLRTIKNEQGKEYRIVENAYLLPKILNAGSELIPEVRYRSIFEVVLYSAKISLQGEFSMEYLERLQIPPEDIRWKDASLILGISDLKGIRDTLNAEFGGKSLSLNPGVSCQNLLPVGLSSGLDISSSSQNHKFNIELLLNGSGEFSIVPVGEQTAAGVKGKWGNPSFLGEFLPVKRTIDQDSFQAEWKVLHLNRNYPQAFTSNNYKLDQSAFGVKLLLPIDEYQKTMRTAKYAIIFIMLTFLAFFVAEILSSRPIHPVQYTLVAVVLLLFYVLLLSLSEHIDFKFSYLIASISVIVLITAYVRTMLSAVRSAIILGSVLTALYIFLYITVQAQDYALLFGSFGLFISMALVMYLTRKIDWFALGKKEKKL